MTEEPKNVNGDKSSAIDEKEKKKRLTKVNNKRKQNNETADSHHAKANTAVASSKSTMKPKKRKSVRSTDCDATNKSLDTMRTLEGTTKEETDAVESDDQAPEVPVVDASSNTVEGTTDERQNSRKRQRVLEREALLAKVPKVDAETGFSYTKQQIRRMRKRVARGLNPVETSAEKHARLMLDAELRKEEETELAGLIVTKSSTKGDLSMDDEDVDEDNEEADEDNEDVDADEPTGDIDQEDDINTDVKETRVDDLPSKAADPFSYEKVPKAASITLAEKPKKKQRDKPVPDDYVCSACQNSAGTVRHWIYDCPHKKRMPGTNQVSRKQRGLNNPADNKVFVSGLPFDSTPADVMALFASPDDENGASNKKQVIHCKLIKFEDTGRCKGQAFVTFDTADAAKRALKLNGTVIENAATIEDKTTKSKVEPKTRKELKLKVTKVLNRYVTKTKK